MSAGTGATGCVPAAEPRRTDTEPNGNRSNYLSVPTKLYKQNTREPIAPSDLLEMLRREGVSVQLVNGSDLRVRAPHGVLTEERRELLRALKPEIIALLRTYPCTKCGRFAFQRPTLCYHCRNNPPLRVA
jgi:hypothetical protein